MAQPISLRFRFHFYGDKPTNRLDKPEYFLSHVLDLLEQHHIFLTDNFQPILDARIQGDDRLDLVYTDAVSAFITALGPMVKAKLPANLVVDCSHANSSKKPELQPLVMADVVNQIRNGNKSLLGVMIESNLEAGNQPIPADLSQLKQQAFSQYDLSIRFSGDITMPVTSAGRSGTINPFVAGSADLSKTPPAVTFQN